MENMILVLPRPTTGVPMGTVENESTDGIQKYVLPLLVDTQHGDRFFVVIRLKQDACS